MLRNRKMKRKIKMLEREIGPETLLVLRGDEK